jgi:hypothetical protein
MLPVFKCFRYLQTRDGNRWFPCRDAAQFALHAGGSYIAAVSRPNPMKRSRIIALAVAIALAFAGGGGPRHVQAATQGHDHLPVSTHSHDHAQHASDSAQHDHHAAASSADGNQYDHAGVPAPDQGCCYAWCNSVAVMHAADWGLIAASHDKPLAFEKPFRIAAFPSAIDPPPR